MAPVGLNIFARCCLGRFARRFVWVFMLVQCFLAIAGVLVLLASLPYVPPQRVLVGVPDALLVALPVSLPLSTFVAGLLLVGDIRRRQGWMWLQLAGGHPWQVLWPVHSCVLVMSFLMAWLNATVVPHAQFHTRYVLNALQEAPDTLAMRLARKPDFLPGYRAEFSGTADGTFVDFALMADDVSHGSTVVLAHRARLALGANGDQLELGLDRGRYLATDAAGNVRDNVRFGHLRLGLDARRLTTPSKREILGLAYYSNQELSLLPDQAEALRDKGLVLGDVQSARVQSIGTARALRLASAALPSLLLLLALMLAGRVGDIRTRGVFVAITICGATLLSQQSILETQVAKYGAIASPVVAIVPVAEVVVFLVIGRLWLRRGSR